MDESFGFSTYTFILQIQDHLKMLQQQYQESVNQREGLKERKVLTALRLQRASVLIAALSDEKVFSFISR